MENRLQIVQKFASVAEHPEQCYDFDIQGNLDTFVTCERTDINFSEAAFLVFDAARIYGRKVDYLEQILLDFNQRSAANISKALAEKALDAENAGDVTKKDKKAQEAHDKREREKERALKRAKRMLKVTSKVEFKPKPFEIATSDEISLNLHEQRSELECEEEFDQLRMKNVFPRINVLQSNLQNNNTFYDNLGIDESDCENLDSLRDFRIFMDTIDEPIFTRPMIGNNVDPRYEQEYKRSMERANQRHSNIYLPAEYIKENYGITLKDNSDYLNMLKYNEEVERLNLRKLTIEQLSKLKVGTYLNNILHGNKQDGKIPEHDSGIDIDDDLDRDDEPPLPDFSTEHTFDELSTLRDESDILMTDLSASNVDGSATKADDSLNISAIPSTDDTVLNSTEEPNSTANDSMLETSVGTDAETEANTSIEASGLESSSAEQSSLEASNLEVSNLEMSKELDRTSSARQSLDDGIGTSECNSPSRLTDVESFVGFNSADITDCADINQLLNAAGEPMDIDNGPKTKLPELDTNIFLLPENLLRRSKIFALSDEFELWMAARKRKFGIKADPPVGGKLLKLSNGALVRVDAESDTEEFLGFDENNDWHTAPSTVVDEAELNPATITNRTCSSDSGISPEKVQTNGEDGNPLQAAVTTTDGTAEVNDSGVGDLNNSADSTLNNTTSENAEQSVQETDMSLSDAIVNANSTKLFNETASILTGIDSGFSELESQLESTAGDLSLDQTNNSTVTTEVESSDKPNAVDGDVDEAIECDDNRHDDENDDEYDEQSDDQAEETARNEGFSDMVERVSKWHEALRPVLANCEQRNNFDIHALGTDIIDMFPEQQQEAQPTEISFTDVMKGRDQTYTARYFLSLLLLTNTKNVHLKVMHPEDNGTKICSKDDMRIKLRSRARHLDEVNKIDQHLNQPKPRKETNAETNKTININYDDDTPIASTSKGKGGKKTTQKRKWNA